MVASDTRNLLAREDDGDGEEMRDMASEEEIFSSRIPGLVEEDGDLRGGGRAQNDDEEDEEDESEGDDESTLASGEGHVYGKNSKLHPFLPHKGYAVFAVAVLLSLICYIAIPIVCLSASHQVMARRDIMASLIGKPSDWALKIVALDSLETRLKVFSLFGEGMLIPGYNASTPITLSTLSSDNSKVTTPSAVVTAVLQQINAVFLDLDHTYALLLNTPSNATAQLTSAFSIFADALQTQLTTTFVAEVVRLFSVRASSRTTLWDLHQQLFQQILPPEATTAVAQTIVLLSEAQTLCSQVPTCVASGGATLLSNLRTNATEGAFRALFVIGDLIDYINTANAQVVSADDMISVVKQWNDFLINRTEMLAMSASLFQSTIAELVRIQSLQNSFNGTTNITSAPSPTAAELSLIPVLSPVWSASMIASVQSALSVSDNALSLLSTQVDAQIRKLLNAQVLVGAGLEMRIINSVSVFDSIYAYDFDTLPAPDQSAFTAAFNANGINQFFPVVRAAYQTLMHEAYATAYHAVAEEEQNSTGASSIDKIQIATSICTILPVAFLAYLLVGVAVRLPESPVSYFSMVGWVLVTYAVFVTASSAMTMIAINQINEVISIPPSSLVANAATNNGADRASALLAQAMGVQLLVQPNTSASVINLNAANSLYAALIADSSVEIGSYTPNIGAMLTNMSTPFLATPLSAQIFRETLSSETSWVTSRASAFEGVTSVEQFDALPACNQSRILGVFNFLTDSYASLQRILDVVHLAESPLSSRIQFQPDRAAKLLACTFCGIANSRAVNPACLRPAPLGLQNHPRDVGAYIQELMYVTRSGWSLDTWNTTSASISRHVTRVQSSLTKLAQYDATEWKHQRRLLVWIAVFGALGLQLIWYVLWRAVFDSTLHANLLP